MTQTYLFRVKPQDFSPVVEVAACYLICNDKFLFLQRASHKPEGDKWGVPGGKIERGETTRQAVIRETSEETGIALDDKKLNYVGKLFIRKPDVDYIYHMYIQRFDLFPTVKVNDEHQDYCWLTEEEVEDLPVMDAGIETLYCLKAMINKPDIPRKPFYFIRHGETDVNASPNIKRVDYDLPLNEKGREQAVSARSSLAKADVNSVYYSPIQRAVETKNLLIDELEIETVELEEISECKAHVWTKMVKLEEGHGFHVCHEVDGFFTRVLTGLAGVLEKEKVPLFVGHGGTHWALCYHLTIENHPWKIGNCELVHFRPVGDDGWKAEVIGCGG